MDPVLTTINCRKRKHPTDDELRNDPISDWKFPRLKERKQISFLNHVGVQYDELKRYVKDRDINNDRKTIFHIIHLRNYYMNKAEFFPKRLHPQCIKQPLMRPQNLQILDSVVDQKLLNLTDMYCNMKNIENWKVLNRFNEASEKKWSFSLNSYFWGPQKRLEPNNLAFTAIKKQALLEAELGITDPKGWESERLREGITQEAPERNVVRLRPCIRSIPCPEFMYPDRKYSIELMILSGNRIGSNRIDKSEFNDYMQCYRGNMKEYEEDPYCYVCREVSKNKKERWECSTGLHNFQRTESTSELDKCHSKCRDYAERQHWFIYYRNRQLNREFEEFHEGRTHYVGFAEINE